MITREKIEAIVIGRGPTGDFSGWRKLEPDESVKAGDLVVVITPMRGETAAERECRIKAGHAQART
jgi:hypothetical protein